jgi:hypothetical protein
MGNLAAVNTVLKDQIKCPTEAIVGTGDADFVALARTIPSPWLPNRQRDRKPEAA